MLKPKMSMNRGFNPNFGKNPTVPEKIGNVAQGNGLGGMNQQQGGPVNVYDTVMIPSSTTGRQTLTFFNSTNNKSQTFSNWNQNGFSAGESLGFTTLTLQVITVSGLLTSDATQITNVFPLGTDTAGVSNTIAFGICEFKIAGSTVFKDFQLIETLPWVNPDSTGLVVKDSAVATEYIYGRTTIQLPTIPVILPNLKIEMNIEVPAFPFAVPATFALMATLGRQGSTMASRTTY